MIETLLLTLLLFVLYRYTTDTLGHLWHSVQVTGRMVLVVVAVILIVGAIAYTRLQFGINIFKSFF